MDHVLVSFHSQAYPTLSTFLFSNTKNRRFCRKVTKAPTLALASMAVSLSFAETTEEPGGSQMKRPNFDQTFIYIWSNHWAAKF